MQRQTLFDEQDLADDLPKAVAAAAKLAAINSRVEIEPIVADVDHRNIAQLAAGVDLILDGTDNFETRYLINDLAVREFDPWIFAGVVGAAGQTMTILPGQTALPALPDARAAAGRRGADLRNGRHSGPGRGRDRVDRGLEALKILSGHRRGRRVARSSVIDLWDNRLRQIDVASLARSSRLPDLPAARISLAVRARVPTSTRSSAAGARCN